VDQPTNSTPSPARLGLQRPITTTAAIAVSTPTPATAVASATDTRRGKPRPTMASEGRLIAGRVIRSAAGHRVAQRAEGARKLWFGFAEGAEPEAVESARRLEQC